MRRFVPNIRGQLPAALPFACRARPAGPGADARSKRGRRAGSKLGTVAIETLYKREKDVAKVAEATREFVAALADWDHKLEDRTFLVGDA